MRGSVFNQRHDSKHPHKTEGARVQRQWEPEKSN